MSTAAAAAAPRSSTRSLSTNNRRSSSRSRRRSTPRTVNLVHFSSREIKEWGKIPKHSEYSDALALSRHRTSFNTGKPPGLWYAYEKDWFVHYKPAVNARKNLSAKNKEAQFEYKYVFEVPKSAFTKKLEPDDSKILVLTLDNFAEFLVKYNAPGVFPDRMVWGGRKPKPIEEWHLVWSGLPAEYTVDGKEYVGVKNLFAGVEFSQDLVEFKPENGFKITSELNKMRKPKIVYEFDLSSDGATRHVVADVSFLRYLEVRSGCLFKAENLFSEPPAHYLAEGPVTTGAAAGAAAGYATGAAAGAAAGYATGAAATGSAAAAAAGTE